MNNETMANAPKDWREILGEMQQEKNRLLEQITQLKRERDQLTKALVAFLGEEIPLSEEEILTHIGQEKPLREFLQEIRAELVGE